MKFKFFIARSKIICSILLGLLMSKAYADRSYNKYWTVATVIGSIGKEGHFKYYLEPQLRLSNQPSAFNQLLLLAGFGYAIQPNLLLFAGPGWILTKTPAGRRFEEGRLWEQLNWLALDRDWISVNSRSRLEQRQRHSAEPIAQRLRQRLWLRLPLKPDSPYAFSCFDELFFNLNRPGWVAPHVLEQNRLFLGIAKQISPTKTLDIGYLNQYLRSRVQEHNNVLLLSFSLQL